MTSRYGINPSYAFLRDVSMNSVAQKNEVVKSAVKRTLEDIGDPVYINEHAQYNRVFVDVNKISAVFGRNSFRDYINRQLRKNNLVRIKNRSTQASESSALIAEHYGMNTSIIDSISPVSQNVNNKIKKSLKDVEGQPIEESSDGTAMQNYSRLHEDAGLETRKQKTPEQLSSP